MAVPQFANLIDKTDHFYLYSWKNSDHSTHVNNSAVPLLVHGLGGCLAWMEPFIQALLEYYPVAYGIDIPYYGPNPDGVGHFTSRHLLTATVVDAIRQVSQNTGKPVLLIGLSLGGLISTHALARATEKLPLCGLVLISPAFKAAPASFKPKIYANVLVNSLLRSVDKPISIPYDLTSITSDHTQQQRLKETTSCVRALTAISYLELLKLTISRKGFDQLHYPLLLIRAEKDDICDINAMDTVWKKWPCRQKQLTVFSNVKHDLVLEPVTSQLAHLVSGWSLNL